MIRGIIQNNFLVCLKTFEPFWSANFKRHGNAELKVENCYFRWEMINCSKFICSKTGFQPNPKIRCLDLDNFQKKKNIGKKIFCF
jgi:hypothetical protein